MGILFPDRGRQRNRVMTESLDEKEMREAIRAVAKERKERGFETLDSADLYFDVMKLLLAKNEKRISEYLAEDRDHDHGLIEYLAADRSGEKALCQKDE